jgi:hypothetical protein
MRKGLITIITILAISCAVSTAAFGQTSSFVYQGKLQENGNAANGTYQFTFKLYDSVSNGNQIGQTVNDLPAAVINGIFSVNLDFGVNSFDGGPRFLEIGVRTSGSGLPYTTLMPRQPMTSAPYAVKSLNADSATTAQTSNNSLNLGGVPAAQYVITTDPRMTDPRDPLPNSSYYIQNSQNPQANSNFNISGEGKANIITSATQFNIGTKRVLSITGTNNLFVGFNAGFSNGTGTENTYVGTAAGVAGSGGLGNTFVGYQAGSMNTGNINSFFGYQAGIKNTSGLRNSSYGAGAGYDNQTGTDNSFFGAAAGGSTTGDRNSYFGSGAGFVTTTGSNNSFFGQDSGRQAGAASNSSYFGYYSGRMATGSGNAFFGNQAGEFTTANDNAFFGNLAGNKTTGASNAFFGSGAGKNNTTPLGNSFFGFESGMTNVTGGENAYFGYQAGRAGNTASNNSFFGFRAGTANTGGNNSFFGRSAGDSNTSASDNSFFGANAGTSNTTGASNAFFGYNAGSVNVSGQHNSYFGAAAGQTSTGTGNAFFGYAAGLLNTSGGSNTFIGSNVAFNNTIGSSNTFIGYNTGSTNSTGTNNTLIGAGANLDSNNLTFATAIGAGAVAQTSNSVYIGRAADTAIVLGKLNVWGEAYFPGLATFATEIRVHSGGGGFSAVCRDVFDRLLDCSSSLRYKTNVQNFSRGLDLVRSLRPITFNWINGNVPDLGFAAEEVAAVEPLLATYNKKGEVEGVKYAQITTALVNAIKEQQTEIEKLQAQIEALKNAVCISNPTAAACGKEERK